MRIVDLIRQKRDGHALSPQAIAALVQGAADGSVPDYQLAAWLMAVFFRGMSPVETAALTRAMLHSGRVLEPRGDRVRADKHSTGGVGDKTSLLIAPLAAALGFAVPMISGRGLGHTGGTLDKLESIPGFRTDLSLDRFEAVLHAHGCAMIGQTAEIAPADRKLYALRDVTATVENLSLITASILGKKLAEGIAVLVLDVKFGSGAFMKDLDSGRRLAESMVRIGREIGVRVQALLTEMEQPLGCAVGNALEVEECLDLLRGTPPEPGSATAELADLSLELTARMAALAAPPEHFNDALAAARVAAARALRSGRGLEIFRAMAVAQGADAAALEYPWKLPRARHHHDFPAPAAGFVSTLDAFEIGQAAMELGAGRARLDSTLDPAAGILIRRRRGDRVAAGETVCTLYYNDAARLELALARVRAACRIAAAVPPPSPGLIREIVG